ncbi:IS630 family transposase domain protein [Rickettsiales endosymbiont of Paramecium tredecaurelia]|uniref:IS630 transposase-related protein n=1 Tax=Candidatus Sarmatiella mevalonica TaxID=2770581 RepID=UPI0019247288|nr:IS630 transposase-related protein [Candidatus Sarmatiella mevalonica]MBL3284920.1 IS630 family transposase domain protein [Candidatus Sarmatiella mevalonica]
MSTKPYSEDLRKRVVGYIQKGKTQKEASEVFGIHSNTVHRWWARYNKEGNYSARRRLGARRRVDYKEIELFVKNNPNTKLEVIGNRFGISSWHSARVLKSLGFSYRKKPLPMWKQVKKIERNNIESIKDVKPEKLVYIDESGIGMSMCKDRGWGQKG